MFLYLGFQTIALLIRHTPEHCPHSSYLLCFPEFLHTHVPKLFKRTFVHFRSVN